jgi:FecR protein
VNTTFKSHEMNRLVSDFCNGTSSEADIHRLDSLLEGDESARQIYNNYMFLHAALYADHACIPLDDDETGAAKCAPGNDQQAVRPRSAAAKIHSSIRTSWIVLAASFIGIAAASSWLTYRATQSHNLANSSGSREAVARITATRNCLWRSPTEGAGFGSTLYSGQQLCLAAGLVEVTFNDGAQVVLEGPATFDLRSKGQAELQEGRIAAVVPERARGFEVSTAGLSVVDLGTEFGMVAERGGETEVHVFRGQVMAHLLDEKGQQLKTVELNTAEAARITPASSMVARIRARDDEFVRSLSVVSGPHDGLYAYDGFTYPAGPLSEQNGGFGWGGPWTSIEAADDEANTNCVSSGSLEYEGMVSPGNRAMQTAQQNRIRRSLSTSVGGVFDTAGLVENQDGMRLVGRDGTTVYLSFLQRVNKLDDVFYGLELHRSDGNGNRVLCIGNGAEHCGYGVTSNFNVYGEKNYPSLGKENTETNFFVVKIVYGVGNRDHVFVYRNPASLADERACQPDAELVGNFAFDRIGFGNFNGTKVHEVDEIRVGTTFLSVTGRQSRGPDRLTPPMAVLGRPTMNNLLAISF